MDIESLQNTLSGLPIASIRYFDQISSTNDEAARWLAEEAPDLALVVADEQTAGRGRLRRIWYTPPGSSLAFSLVLKQLTPEYFESGASPGLYQSLSRLTGLGALAVCQALRQDYQLPALIKWPNDVLIARRKVAGVLVEAHWQGDHLDGIVIGIGVNVKSSAVLQVPELTTPATWVEAALGKPVDRLALLRTILEHLLAWRIKLNTPEFLQFWAQWLAFRGEWVQLAEGEGGTTRFPEEVLLLGLNPDGSLRVHDRHGRVYSLRSEEVRIKTRA